METKTNGKSEALTGASSEACRKKLKGDFLYYFSEINADWTFLDEKYKDWKGIEKYSNEEYFKKFTDMLDELRKSKIINKKEEDFLFSGLFFYFNAFISWLDDSQNVKIVIE